MYGHMGISIGIIRRHEQFLKNYNMIRQIGHRYNTNTTLQMKCPYILVNNFIIWKKKVSNYWTILK